MLFIVFLHGQGSMWSGCSCTARTNGSMHQPQIAKMEKWCLHDYKPVRWSGASLVVDGPMPQVIEGWAKHRKNRTSPLVHLDHHAILYETNQFINQSINQFINQSINQSIKVWYIFVFCLAQGPPTDWCQILPVMIFTHTGLRACH